MQKQTAELLPAALLEIPAVLVDTELSSGAELAELSELVEDAESLESLEVKRKSILLSRSMSAPQMNLPSVPLHVSSPPQSTDLGSKQASCEVAMELGLAVCLVMGDVMVPHIPLE